MMNNKVTRIIANSVGLAAVAALGITVYQLGTSPVKEKTPEEKTENVGESTQDTEEQLSEDAGTNHVESENQWISDDGEDLDDTKVTFKKQGMYGETAQNTVDNNESDNTADVDKTDNAVNSQQAEESSVNANMKSQTISEDQADEATDVSASALNLATVNFSEDTLMEWPVNGNVLLDYSMDQTTYFPTLDQYKLSPAIAVGAVEGAPVVAAVNGKVYSIEQNAQTGTTLTMELTPGHMDFIAEVERTFKMLDGAVLILSAKEGIQAPLFSSLLLPIFQYFLLSITKSSFPYCVFVTFLISCG